jgi:DNA-binding CsgD family transcriptional regulator
VSTPLRCRDDELDRLTEQLDRLRTGVGAVWLIEGAAGLGKSRLLDEVLRAARAADFDVGHGVAEPADRAVQLAPLMDALFGGPSPPLSRADLGAPASPREQRYWLLQDIQELLEQTALRRPLVVCLDDLHWSDSGTAAALRSLPGRLAALPISWVLAYRPAEADADLDRAVATLAGAGASVTVLQRFDDAGVAEVSRDVFQAEPDDGILALASDVGGNPFLVMELLSGLRDERLVEIRDGRAILVESRLPRRVGDSMRRRLGRMSPGAVNIAAVAASMGRRFTVSELSAVLEKPAASLLEPLTELIRSEVLTDSSGRLGFSHDLIRQAVRSSQPVTAVHALDRQAAAALIAAGALPVEVATQLASSASPGDDVAVTMLMKAADDLGATDPGQAADLATRALELTSDSHPLRGPLVARIAVLLHAAARTDEATKFADTALHDTLPVDQEAQVRLGIAKLFSLSAEARVEACRRALELSGVPSDLRARLLAQLLYNLAVGIYPEPAEEILEEARQAVQTSNDGEARFTLLIAESYLRYASEDFPAALTLADAATRASVIAGEDTSQHLARNLRCGMLAVTDRLDEALAVATDGIRSAQRGRQAWALNTFEIRRGWLLAQRGQLGDAAAALVGRYPLEDAHLVVAGLEAAGLVTLGRIALHTGEQSQLNQTAAVASVMLHSGIPKAAQHAAWLLALQAMGAGNPDQARRYLSVGGDGDRLMTFPLFPFDPTDDPHLVRIALASGDRELAHSVVEAARRRCILNPSTPSILASADQAEGLATRSRELLVRAVTTFARGQRRLALASALEDLAVIETADGEAAAAIATLDRALASYTECGASWDSARIRRRLRRLGVRRRLARERRPTHGWDALTESELAVVRLVADGLTNRQVAERLFISPHTVNGHLRQAFDKLGINSRVNLARFAAEHLS